MTTSSKRRPKRLRARRKTPLTLDLILAWADDHRQRTGRWPEMYSGHILADPDEVWVNVDKCLRKGFRSLLPGLSLAQLLTRERGYRNPTRPPKLTEDQIAGWILAYRQQTGEWPHQDSGPLEGQPGETWANLDSSMLVGLRGLPAGGSLARFIEARFGVQNPSNLPPLDIDTILAWADEHRRRTGRWPVVTAGNVALAPQETWARIDDALCRGSRGLPGGSTLVKLLVERRGRRHPHEYPPLTVEQILAWADDHHRRTGRWPDQNSGKVMAAPDEMWSGVNNALKKGKRGLLGKTSLARMLRAERGPQTVPEPQPLTVEQILAWAEDHHDRTGSWPQSGSGEVLAAPGTYWSGVNNALRRKERGLTCGGSLADLLDRAGLKAKRVCKLRAEAG